MSTTIVLRIDKNKLRRNCQSFCISNSLIHPYFPQNLISNNPSGVTIFDPEIRQFYHFSGCQVDCWKNKFSPNRIFICDESGISTVPNKDSKIFSLKWKKVGCISFVERGTPTTDALDFYISPLLIFPTVRKCVPLEQGLPPKSITPYNQS